MKLHLVLIFTIISSFTLNSCVKETEIEKNCRNLKKWKVVDSIFLKEFQYIGKFEKTFLVYKLDSCKLHLYQNRAMSVFVNSEVIFETKISQPFPDDAVF